MARILFVITEDWALVTHRLHLVEEAIKAGHVVGVVTRVSTFRAELEDLGANLYHWRLTRGSISILSEMAALIDLNTTIRDFQPDLIHAVALKPVIYTGLITKFRFTGGVVSALGGVGFVFSSSSVKAKILRRLASWLLRFVLIGPRRLLILQNDDDLELLCEMQAVKKSGVRIVGGAGVETDIFKFTQVPEKPIRVILPARILWDKGVGEFKRMATRVRKTRPEVTFVLVGDTDPQNPATVSEHQLDSWLKEGDIEQMSGVAHNQMPEIYRQSTLVCFPSFREGLPKALLEAASTGRAMIAFDVPGCREIVKENVTGRLIPFGDEASLEAALIDLIDNSKKREIFGVNARRLVEQKFSAVAIDAEVFAIWDELLSKS